MYKRILTFGKTFFVIFLSAVLILSFGSCHENKDKSKENDDKDKSSNVDYDEICELFPGEIVLVKAPKHSFDSFQSFEDYFYNKYETYFDFKGFVLMPSEDSIIAEKTLIIMHFHGLNEDQGKQHQIAVKIVSKDFGLIEFNGNYVDNFSKEMLSEAELTVTEYMTIYRQCSFVYEGHEIINFTYLDFGKTDQDSVVKYVLDSLVYLE